MDYIVLVFELARKYILYTCLWLGVRVGVSKCPGFLLTMLLDIAG